MGIANNKKNYQKLSNPLFEKKGQKRWPGSFHEAVSCLNMIPLTENTQDFLKYKNISEEVEIIIRDWDFKTITKSALYFFLEQRSNTRISKGLEPFNKYDCQILTELMLSSVVGEDIIQFFNKLYSVPKEIIILGAYHRLRNFFLFSYLKISKKSLNDFLDFLEIDILTKEILINISFKDKNFSKLSEFLSIYDCSLNKNLVFSKALEFYKNNLKSFENHIGLQEIELNINENLEITKQSLEEFDIFNMFDSSEQFQSRSNEILIFSFYKNLLLDENQFQECLKLFKLFEIYLYSVKDKSIWITNINFKKSSKFYNFIQSFCFENKEKLKNILNSNSKSWQNFYKSKKDFDLFLTGSLFFIIAVLCLNKNSKGKTQPSSILQNNCFASISLPVRSSKNITKKIDTSTETSVLQQKTVSANTDGQKQPVSTLITKKKKSQKIGSQILTKDILDENLEISDSASFKLKQTRPSALNALISYNKTTRGPKFSQNTIQAQRFLETTKLSIISDNSKAIAGIQAEMKSLFPNNLVVVEPVYTSINGKLVETNKLTMIQSSVPYGLRAEFKAKILSLITETTATVVFNNLDNVHADHTLNQVLRNAFNISEERGHAVFINANFHKALTNARTYQLEGKFGYSPGDLGSTDILKQFLQKDIDIIVSFYNDPVIVDRLGLNGLDPIGFVESYTHSYNSDLATVERMMGNEMDKNSYLACSFSNLINENISNSCESLRIRLSRKPQQNMQDAAVFVNKTLDSFLDEREHSRTVGTLLQPGTFGLATHNIYENKALNEASLLINHVRDRGGVIDSQVENTFLSDSSTNPMTVKDASTFALNRFENLKNPPEQSFIRGGNRTFLTNYKK